ncbi:MAG: hypothetical protein QM500_17040 [Methylococcales bacterium]
MGKQFLLKIKTFFVFWVFITLLSSCGGNNESNDTVAVANAFWNNLMSPFPENALPYISERERLTPVFNGYTEGDTFKFVKVDRSMQGVIGLDTLLYITRNNKLKVIPIKTILVQKNGVWLVDYYSTQASLYDAVIEKVINDSGKMLITGVETLESEMPDFKGKVDKALHGQIESYMGSFTNELFNGINSARVRASQVYENRGEGSVSQRMKLLEGAGKG